MDMDAIKPAQSGTHPTALSNNNAKVSVVIPAHNHAPYLREAVESALNQGAILHEVIVVDDGSTDNTPDILEALKQSRVHSLRLGGEGPSAARNAGWRRASGETIFFLDADDALTPGSLDALCDAGKATEWTAIPYGHAEVFWKDFNRPSTFTSYMARTSGSLQKPIALNFMTNGFVALYPRRFIEEIQGFRNEIRYGEDFDFALRMALRWPFQYIDRTVYLTRMHETNRHTRYPSQACVQYCDVVDKAFAERRSPSDLILARRAKAHWRWVSAMRTEESGHKTEAHQLFKSAIAAWPLHRGAINGWWRTR